MRKPTTLSSTEVLHAPVALGECTLARAVGAVGDAWTLLILREAVFGVGKFNEMQADLGIPKAVLANRLRKLVDLEIVSRRDGAARGYDLTDRGRALLPALLALANWAAEWLPGGPSPLTVAHSGCDREIRTVMVCECEHLVSHEEVTIDRRSE